MRRSTAAERLEFLVLFALLLPFYLVLLPAKGLTQAAGFAYLALICSYMLFLSPHRNPDPAARASLFEAPAITCWIMAVLWGVMPQGWWGRRIGIALLVPTVLYILFGSARRHGDTPEDWGVGGPARTRALLAGPDGPGLMILIGAVNAAILALCVAAPEVVSDVMRGVLRKCLGIKTEIALPWPAVAAIALTVANALIAVARWDNLRRALSIVAVYLAGLIALIATGGYLYIYAYGGGWVEVDPVRGMVGMTAYAFWGSLQELLFLSYFNTRVRKGVASPLLSALLTAVIFSLFHLRAYTLVALCFLVGIAWALIFQAAPNLFALGLSHGISGGFGSLFRVKGMALIKFQGSVGPFNP